jgi:hypothetical protein
MKLIFSGSEVSLEHKTLYGNLTQLVNAANVYRVSEHHANGTRKKPIQMQSLVKSDGFLEQCRLLEEDDTFELLPEGAFYVNGRGAKSSTHAHLMILVYAAQQVSSTFLYEFNKRVVQGELMALRDSGGDNFKLLNVAMDCGLEDRKGRNNTGVYINVAKMLRKKIFNIDEWNAKEQGNIWNSNLATAERQQVRADIEQRLVDYIKMGFVKTYPELKSVIEKL